MAKSFIRIVESVKEKYTNFNIRDDLRVPDELIRDKVHDWRATLIRDEFRSTNIIDQNYYQKTCCIEITCEAQSCTIGNYTVPSGTVIWSVELPALVTGVGWKDILYLGPDNMLTNFDRYSLSGLAGLQGNIWTGNEPAYTTIGNIAYFLNLPTSGSRFLCLVALVNNPTVVCDYDLDADIYPTPSDTKLEMLVLKDLLSVAGIRLDEAQDTRDNPTITPKEGQQLNKQMQNE